MEKWASCVHPGLHTLGIASTQRCEATFSALKQVVTRNGNMVDLNRALLSKVQDDAIKTQRWAFRDVGVYFCGPLICSPWPTENTCVLHGCVLANCPKGAK